MAVWVWHPFADGHLLQGKLCRGPIVWPAESDLLVGRESNPCCPSVVGLRTAYVNTVVSTSITFRPRPIFGSSHPVRTQHTRKDFDCDLAVVISKQAARDRTFLTASFLFRKQTRARFGCFPSVFDQLELPSPSVAHLKCDDRNQSVPFGG